MAAMSGTDLRRKVADLTVLELQELLNSLEDSENADFVPPPEEIDIATTVGELTTVQFITVVTKSLPRGLPKA